LIEHVSAGAEVPRSTASDMGIPLACDGGPIESFAANVRFFAIPRQQAKASGVTLGDIQNRFRQRLKKWCLVNRPARSSAPRARGSPFHNRANAMADAGTPPCTGSTPKKPRQLESKPPMEHRFEHHSVLWQIRSRSRLRCLLIAPKPRQPLPATARPATHTCGIHEAITDGPG
jgi:hypothetical protein